MSATLTGHPLPASTLNPIRPHPLNRAGDGARGELVRLQTPWWLCQYLRCDPLVSSGY
jgi:hypothetical protein